MTELDDLGLEDSPSRTSWASSCCWTDAGPRAAQQRPRLHDPRGRAGHQRLLDARRVPARAGARSRELGIAGLAVRRATGCPARGALVDGHGRDGAGAGSTRRSPRSWACTAAWRWGRSTCAAPRSRSERWLPPMARHGADRRLRADRAGRTGPTSPAASRPRPGATATTGCSTARRSGSATPAFADLVVIWARDDEDDEVKGFVVEKDTAGLDLRRARGQDRPAGRAERRDHPATTCASPRRTGCRGRGLPDHRRRPAADPDERRVVGGRAARAGPTSTRCATPRRASSSAARSRRSSSSRTCW